MVTCPNQHCAGQIAAVIKESDGICPIRCAHCGHAGFVVTGGLHLVFRTGQEFCFTVGTTGTHLIMLLPAEALYAYQWLGVAQEDLARYAAEWLLLLGYKAGTFTLSSKKHPFEGFARYVEDRVPRLHPHLA